MALVAEIKQGMDGGLDVSFDYSEEMVEALKRGIPSGCRRYTPRTKVWWVNEHHATDLAELFGAWNYRVLGIHAGPTTGDANPWTDIFNALDDELGQKLYRVLALTLHPDRGGNPEMMRDINVAWDRVNPA